MSSGINSQYQYNPDGIRHSQNDLATTTNYLVDANWDYAQVLGKRNGKTRELPIADADLMEAIQDYLDERMLSSKMLRPNDPLILSQKGGAYSPNTLQGHISKMLRLWAGIARASSHSGRRTLATKLLRDQGEPLAVVQELL
ncbi:MAG: tyrosine-type recombinase/integrase [Granulosicoccus sp.]